MDRIRQIKMPYYMFGLWTIPPMNFDLQNPLLYSISVRFVKLRVLSGCWAIQPPKNQTKGTKQNNKYGLNYWWKRWCWSFIKKIIAKKPYIKNEIQILSGLAASERLLNEYKWSREESMIKQKQNIDEQSNTKVVLLLVNGIGNLHG